MHVQIHYLKANFILTIFSLFFLISDARTQNLDPPFPRIGQLYFYWEGANAETWKNHDLVAIRHEMGNFAKNIKEKNPDVLLLAANGLITNGVIKDITKKDVPEEWIVHYDNFEIPPKLWSQYLMNLTNECPEAEYIYGRQKFNEFLAQLSFEHTNWDYFDGIYFDAWILALRWMGYETDRLDLDYDGKADGAGVAESRWSQGNKTLINNLRVLINKPIICHEAGQSYFLNGNAFEFWSQLGNPVKGRAWNMSQALSMLNNCVSPSFNYANSEAEGTGAVFRADFTSAQIVGAFFGHDEGTFAHRWTFLHDEYEGNLGYPTSSPETIGTGLWIRYFDNGVLISNISGLPKVVNANQLTGGLYYRFRGNQSPDFNNGYPVDNNHPIILEEFDGIMLFKQPTTLVTPIIIDNVKYNMTTIGQSPARYDGSWTQSKKGNQAYSFRYGWDSYAYFHAYSPPGDGGNTATYNPKINIPGEFEVFEWHGQLESGLNVASNVPYEIIHNNGTFRGTIDQTKNREQWNSLGVYHFEQGRFGYVKITNDANGYVISDAIKFVCTKSTPPPPPRMPPNPPRNFGLESRTENSITLSWQSPSPASDGNVASYYKIIRDDVSLGTTYETNYTDVGLESYTTYNYKIYSVDDIGQMSLTAATGSFNTGGDEIPPEIKSVRTLSLNTVEVVFSEAIETGSAENINNYSINYDISINQAQLQSDTKSVYLQTSTHTAGQSYTLTINNIIDRAPAQNVIAPNTTISYTAVDNIFISISADNKYELYVNGNFVGEGNNWWDAESYVVPLVLEKNLIAVKGMDIGDEAGLVVEIKLSGKTLVSDDTWKFSAENTDNWQASDFNDNSWSRAVSYGEHGSPDALPWGGTPNGGIVSGLSTDKGIKWIWSNDFVGDDIVYFRFKFSLEGDMTPPAQPQGVTVTTP